jgi:MFS family permease
VIANRAFAAARLTIMLVTGIWFTVLLYAPQYMEKVLGFTAPAAGVGFLLLLTFSAAASASGPVYNRLGPKLPLLAGTTCIAVGAVLLSLVQPDSPYVAMVPGLIVSGAGVGPFFSTVTNTALSRLDPARTGSAAGLRSCSSSASGAVGVGIATTVFTSALRGHAGAHVAFVSGLHAGLRVEATMAGCGRINVWGVLGARSGPTAETAESSPAELLA